MFKRSLMGLALVATVALVACTPDDEPETTVDWGEFDKQQAEAAEINAAAATQNDVGSLLNVARAQNGLPALSPSPQLTAAAQAHVQDMVGKGFFSHIGSDNSRPSQRVRAQGYSFCYVAENIAQGQKTPAEVMTTWMASSGHRANNLSNEVTQYGTARGAGDLWVLVFARPGC